MQPNLFDQQAKLRQAAADWIEANPRAFALFERFALSLAERGRSFGMKALAERVRWEVLATWEKDAEGYQKQEVTLGESDGERIEIKSGVKAGDRVATQGAIQVKLASASNAIPAHNHNH